MRFGSVCSGIEAASVAWAPLGWKAAWLAEIEPFPCAVLAHHYPSVPNLGDMTKIARAILTGEVPPPDVLCGGTPCQAFSVAGLRESLSDARGNLTLKFVEIADAIDHVRVGRGEDECIVFWENVPGVLSTRDNAFGCFLGGLAGEDGPLEPPGGKWANAGAVYGPARAVAWRALDAQYFGVAQRRRRVFVVASARKGFDPAAVLFEWDGVRRDTAPSREAGQGVTHDTAPCLTSSGRGVERTGDTRGQDPVVAVALGGNNQSGPIDVATARNACSSASGLMDFETETFLVQPTAYAVRTANTSANGHGIAEEATHTLDQAQGQAVCVTGDITHTLKAEGFDASEDGTGRGTPLVPVAQPIPIDMRQASRGATMTNNRAEGTSGGAPGTGIGNAGDPAPTLSGSHVAAIAFDTTQITSADNRSNPKPDDPCHPLAAGAHPPTIAFPANLSGTQCASTENLSPALGAVNPTAVAFAIQAGALRTNPLSGPGGIGVQAEHAYTLEARAEVQAVAVSLRGRDGGATAELGGDIQNCLRASGGGGDKPHVLTAMQVRRLTPTECERLQGFPDDYTAIPWRGKPADQCPDGPRYRSLGNSWAVPNVRWIGERIAAAVKQRCA